MNTYLFMRYKTSRLLQPGSAVQPRHTIKTTVHTGKQQLFPRIKSLLLLHGSICGAPCLPLCMAMHFACPQLNNSCSRTLQYFIGQHTLLSHFSSSNSAWVAMEYKSSVHWWDTKNYLPGIFSQFMSLR